MASFLSSRLFRSVDPLKQHMSRLHLLLVISPLIAYFICVQFAKSYTYFYRDPTSAYFDNNVAFDRWYTAVRLNETQAFVAQYNQSDSPDFKRRTSSLSEPPYMCVGFSSIARPSGDVYARDSLASLLAGLDQKERDLLYAIPLIAHINASDHPMYSEPWLARVTDRVLTYKSSETLPKATYEKIEKLERERQRTGQPDRQKYLLDYTHLLRVCAATGARYVTLLEDDALAMDGWFHRTRRALNALEQQNGPGGWFYLRLFYTENYLGFNSDYATWYAAYIVLYSVAAFAIFKLAMLHLQKFTRAAGFLSKAGPMLSVTAVLSFILVVVFVFRAGKVALLGNSQGVVYMPKNGCCSQALAWPAEKVETLARWFEMQQVGFVDVLAERLADEKPEGFGDVGGRWAISPSVMQHVGGQSSKGDGWPADMLWNFEYEFFDAEKLKAEHDIAVKAMGWERKDN